MVIYFFVACLQQIQSANNGQGAYAFYKQSYQSINNIYFIDQKNQIVPMNNIMKWEINQKSFVFATSLTTHNYLYY